MRPGRWVGPFFKIRRSLRTLVTSAEKPSGWVVLGSELDFAGDRFTRDGCDEGQGEINARGNTGGGPDVAVPDDAFLADLDISKFGET